MENPDVVACRLYRRIGTRNMKFMGIIYIIAMLAFWYNNRKVAFQIPVKILETINNGKGNSQTVSQLIYFLYFISYIHYELNFLLSTVAFHSTKYCKSTSKLKMSELQRAKHRLRPHNLGQLILYIDMDIWILLYSGARTLHMR